MFCRVSIMTTEYTTAQFQTLIDAHLTPTERQRYMEYTGATSLAAHMSTAAYTYPALSREPLSGPMFPFIVEGHNALATRAPYDMTTTPLELRLWHWVYFCVYTGFAQAMSLDDYFGELLMSLDEDDLVYVTRAFKLCVGACSGKDCTLETNLHAYLARALLTVPMCDLGAFATFMRALFNVRYLRTHALRRLADAGVALTSYDPGYVYRLVHHLQYAIEDVASDVQAVYDEVAPNRQWPLLYLAAWMDLDEVALDTRHAALTRAIADVDNERHGLESLLTPLPTWAVDHMLFDADLYLTVIPPERLLVEILMHRMGFIRLEQYPEDLLTSCGSFVDGPLRTAFDALDLAMESGDVDTADDALVAAGRLLTRVPYFDHFSSSEARRFYQYVCGKGEVDAAMPRVVALHRAFDALVKPVFAAATPLAKLQALCRATGQVRDAVLPFHDHMVVNTYLTMETDPCPAFYADDARACAILRALNATHPSTPKAFADLLDAYPQ